MAESGGQMLEGFNFHDFRERLEILEDKFIVTIRQFDESDIDFDEWSEILKTEKEKYWAEVRKLVIEVIMSELEMQAEKRIKEMFNANL